MASWQRRRASCTAPSSHSSPTLLCARCLHMRAAATRSPLTGDPDNYPNLIAKQPMVHHDTAMPGDKRCIHAIAVLWTQGPGALCFSFTFRTAFLSFGQFSVCVSARNVCLHTHRGDIPSIYIPVSPGPKLHLLERVSYGAGLAGRGSAWRVGEQTKWCGCGTHAAGTRRARCWA